MRLSNQLCGCVAGLSLGFIAGPAAADTLNWTGAVNNNWNDRGNWSPNWDETAMPPVGPGDDLVIGDQVAPTTVSVNGKMPGGDPASVTVGNNVRFEFIDQGKFNPLNGPDDVLFTFQSGSELYMRRNSLSDMKAVFHGGSHMEISHGGTMSNTDNPAWTIADGTVTVGVVNGNGAGGSRNFSARLEGSGNLHFSYDDTNTADAPNGTERRLVVRGGHNNYFGDMRFVMTTGTGLFEWQAGLMTNGDIEIGEGVRVVVRTKANETQPFSDTTILRLEGAGDDKATLTFFDTTAAGGDTLLGLVLGGVAVPAGTYTTSELNALNGGQFAGYLFTHNSSSEPVDYTWTILSTIPEPASLALLAMGGLCLAMRRRNG